MPHYTASFEIACPVAELFAFFATPANLVPLSPPDWHVELVTGPARLELGARLTWKGRRWGVSQRIVQEITAFDVENRIVVEQKQGPFARWAHEHRFEEIEAGTRLSERIDFEPPTGLLGRLIDADAIRKDLEKLYAYRESKLREIFRS